MATGQYVGVSGVARKVTTPYIGVDGVARKVTSGYVGVEGVARLFFAPEGGTIILEVAKQTATTYSGSTSYADESFILLDIYPKSASSTVKVTFGDLTKTLTFSGTNAQQVYFGTFNGVTDSVDTPDSGTLTIDGGCSGFACSQYQNGSKTSNTAYCGCITAVTEWGSVTEIYGAAFRACSGLTSISIPDSVTTIGASAFYNCTNLALTELPSGITSIGSYAFYNCTNLALTELPSGITSIGSYAFRYCDNLVFSSSFFGNKITSIGEYAFYRYARCYNVSIILPSTLSTVGKNAFSYHQGYAESGASGYGNGITGTITLLGATPPSIEVSTTEGSFGGSSYIDSLTFIVPNGSKDAYLAGEMWSTYADYIVEAA